MPGPTAMTERDAATRDVAAATGRFLVHGTEPSQIDAPSSAASAAALLAEASSRGEAVECVGAGTWLSWGRPAARFDRIVSTARLSGIEAHEPADLVLTARAGTPLEALRAAAASANQAVPFDPPALPGATLGAAVALGEAGPLRTAWGTPRDNVLGLDLVTGDGRVLRLGGRVVKNVAGYDLVRLVVGSRGTLGLITRIHIRLWPAPAQDHTFVAFAAKPEALLSFAHEVVLPALPAALELLGPATARAIGLAEPTWALLGRFRGNASGVGAATAAVARSGRVHRAAILDPDRADGAWMTLNALEAAAPWCVRIALPAAALIQAVESAANLGADSPKRRSANDLETLDRWLLAAHVNDGIVRLWTAADVGPGSTFTRADPTAPVLGRLVDVRTRIERLGGSLQLPIAPIAVVRGFDPVGDPGPAVRLMQGLKRTFDPAGILSPGRFIA